MDSTRSVTTCSASNSSTSTLAAESLRTHPPRTQAALGAAPYHAWTLPDGRSFAEFHRSASACLVRFPGYADFHVPLATGPVECWPAPGATEGTLEHLYLNQVLPLVRSRDGFLALHASCVAVGDGAIAFVGESGQGKSTLAASFALAGHALLADDATVAEPVASGRWRIHPSHPSVRLWEDSREALRTSGLSVAPAVQFTDKARLLAGPGLRTCGAPQTLKRIYVLGAHSESVRLARMTPAEAAHALLHNTFLLDTDQREALAAHFDKVSRLAASPIFFGLDFPRAYEALESVRDQILAHVDGGAVPEEAQA